MRAPSSSIRRMPKRFALLWSAGLAIAVALPLAAAVAEGITEITGDISILDAAVEPARSGATTDIRVTFENKGSRRVRVVCVETASGEQGTFDLHARSGSIHSGGFTLEPGEQTVFDGDRARLLLGPLKRDLNEGDVVELTFRFDFWSATVPAHVHAGGPSK